MRKHTVTNDDNGWTHEEIVEDGKFERSGFSIGSSERKIGVGYRKDLFWGTGAYRHHSYVLSKRESIVAIVVFGLLSILIFTLMTLYGKLIS